MTAQEYREILAVFDLGLNEAGRFFGATEDVGRKWAKDGPPGAVAKFLLFMLARDYVPEDVDRAIRRWERRIDRGHEISM